MNPKQQALNNKQRERRQRGHDFQEEILESLRFVPNVWTIHIKDGPGGSRPADRIILTEKINILAELKRTEGQRFYLSFLRTNQLQGLVDFDQVIERNLGLVFVSFHNPKKTLDETYVFRLTTALQYMQRKDRLYIDLKELQEGAISTLYLPRQNDIYDLQEVNNLHCKSL
ncbi:hypothetical protein [Ornithinibacillus sp. JPR2-1]|uniref:hypothetical protein n=1 Tax=Ornithinibacillus sp. JPR2-1 TaxID=2094019 RepID=UPI0031E43866